jgi:hypothetical protein
MNFKMMNRVGFFLGLATWAVIASGDYVTNAGAEEGKSSFYKFDGSGKLLQPKGYREWVFVGSPLTPNDMNNGKAAFPEFHHV